MFNRRTGQALYRILNGSGCVVEEKCLPEEEATVNRKIRSIGFARDIFGLMRSAFRSLLISIAFKFGVSSESKAVVRDRNNAVLRGFLVSHSD